MELFYSPNIQNGTCILEEEEGRHCMKVLRHTPGDSIRVIDGKGNLYACKIKEAKKEVICEVTGVKENFGVHPYRLTLAVAPTKNIDRYEWFLEKATEIGIDRIVPFIGEHSERKVIKPERLEKILVSAAKQSLKGTVPELCPPVGLGEFIKGLGEAPDNELRLIAYCGEAEKHSLPDMVRQYIKHMQQEYRGRMPEITILIGPEGDFSGEEMELAAWYGFRAVHLGESRLRTETAAVAAVSCIYFILS